MSHNYESYLALFCRQIWRTLEILEKDQDKNDDKKQNQDNAYIVLTLSGFTNDFGSSWHTKARENCKRIKDPYVRAMINFLTIPYNEHRNAFYLSGVQFLVRECLKEMHFWSRILLRIWTKSALSNNCKVDLNCIFALGHDYLDQ